MAMLEPGPKNLDWDYVYSRYSDVLSAYQSTISEAEARRGIKFTRGANEMLLIPVVEMLEKGWIRAEPVAFDEQSIQLSSSLDEIISATAKDPDVRDADERSEVRSSFSILKAFSNTWCHIPPFCSGRE